MNYKEIYEKWLNSPMLDNKSKEELLSIKDNDDEIKSRFYCDLEFGTAGLRGVMAAGTNRMNVYIIRRATQGFANLIKSEGSDAMKKGVVIGFDCRNNSDVFAREAAMVLAGNGIRTFLFEKLCPTPQVSFAIRELSAIAGINVTASHNPAEYNGYKVYWEDGAQLGPDHANIVLDEINKLDVFTDINLTNYDEALGNGMITLIGEDMDKKYMDAVKTQLIDKDVITKVADDIKIIYTPFHGTGYKLVPAILKEIGFNNVSYVEEQMIPDGNFPTVKSPNPENSEGFALAIEKAKKEGCDIIIGTDPDADRVAMVVCDNNGEYKVISGNQAGALLADYIITARKENGTLADNACIVKTIVSTEMVTKICKDNGVNIMNVLTGFKFIGEKIKEFEETGEFTYILGFEESIGYLVGTHARDKDAIVSTMMFAQMAAYYKDKGISLYDALQNLYKKYGYFLEKTENIFFEGIDGSEKMKNLMETYRNNIPKAIGGLAVKEFRDYNADTKKDMLTGNVTSTGLPKSNVLYYLLEDNSVAVIRPSGTEPKIKIYLMVNGDNMQNCKNKLSSIADDFLKDIK